MIIANRMRALLIAGRKKAGSNIGKRTHADSSLLQINRARFTGCSATREGNQPCSEATRPHRARARYRSLTVPGKIIGRLEMRADGSLKTVKDRGRARFGEGSSSTDRRGKGIDTARAGGSLSPLRASVRMGVRSCSLSLSILDRGQEVLADWRYADGGEKTIKRSRTSTSTITSTIGKGA
jgi:hypothetical protein